MSDHNLVECKIDDVRDLFRQYHGYGDAGAASTYCFGLLEEGRFVAAFVWQPPAFGAAKAVSPVLPWAVLALSRMVAVPRTERVCQRLSVPLKEQFKRIDRTRWPALITYSDEGQGHNGWVYRCARMKRTARRRVRFFEDSNGVRRSSLSNGRTNVENLVFGGYTWINRWEHWACKPNDVIQQVHGAGWIRVPVKGKTWSSGNPAFRITHISEFSRSSSHLDTL